MAHKTSNDDIVFKDGLAHPYKCKCGVVITGLPHESDLYLTVYDTFVLGKCVLSRKKTA